MSKEDQTLNKNITENKITLSHLYSKETTVHRYAVTLHICSEKSNLKQQNLSVTISPKIPIWEFLYKKLKHIHNLIILNVSKPSQVLSIQFLENGNIYHPYQCVELHVIKNYGS